MGVMTFDDPNCAVISVHECAPSIERTMVNDDDDDVDDDGDDDAVDVDDAEDDTKYATKQDAVFHFIHETQTSPMHTLTGYV